MLLAVCRGVGVGGCICLTVVVAVREHTRRRKGSVPIYIDVLSKSSAVVFTRWLSHKGIRRLQQQVYVDMYIHIYIYILYQAY